MQFNWVIDVSTVISALSFFGASLTIFLNWRKHAYRMDATLETVQKEITAMQRQLERLADVAIKMAVNDERINSIYRRIENLRCMEMHCPNITS